MIEAYLQGYMHKAAVDGQGMLNALLADPRAADKDRDLTGKIHLQRLRNQMSRHNRRQETIAGSSDPQEIASQQPSHTDLEDLRGLDGQVPAGPSALSKLMKAHTAYNLTALRTPTAPGQPMYGIKPRPTPLGAPPPPVEQKAPTPQMPSIQPSTRPAFKPPASFRPTIPNNSSHRVQGV